MAKLVGSKLCSRLRSLSDQSVPAGSRITIRRRLYQAWTADHQVCESSTRPTANRAEDERMRLKMKLLVCKQCNHVTFEIILFKRKKLLVKYPLLVLSSLTAHKSCSYFYIIIMLLRHLMNTLL